MGGPATFAMGRFDFAPVLKYNSAANNANGCPMRLLIATLFLVSINAHAQQRPTSSAPRPISKTARAPSVAETSSSPVRGFYLSTNFLALAQSQGNASVDLFADERVSLHLNFATSSGIEEITKDRVKGRYVVERSQYGLGGTFFLRPISSRRNLLFNPYLLFGSQRENSVDSRARRISDLRSDNGIGIKSTGLIRVARDLTAEVGLSMNNLSGDFKGTFHAGVGYIF